MMNFFNNRSSPAKNQCRPGSLLHQSAVVPYRTMITARGGEAKATLPHRGMGESTTIQRESDESDTQDFILFLKIGWCHFPHPQREREEKATQEKLSSGSWVVLLSPPPFGWCCVPLLLLGGDASGARTHDPKNILTILNM